MQAEYFYEDVDDDDIIGRTKLINFYWNSLSENLGLRANDQQLKD